MRNLILAVMLILPLAGCQSTTVEQDPLGKTLPLGTISTLNVAFHPNSLPYVRSVSIWRFEKIPDIVGIGATGAYIPFTKTVLMGDNATYPDRTLVHEMLHVIFFKEEYPYPELFAQDLERFLKDEDYADIIQTIELSLAYYRKSPRCPKAFMDDEYYAHIGERLYAQDRGGEKGLPFYMARHYHGVLNPLLVFDSRYYEDKVRPQLDEVRAEFQLRGRSVIVTDSMLHLRALVRHGGVIRPKDGSSTAALVVGSVGAAEQPVQGEYLVAPGTEPTSIALRIQAPGYRIPSIGTVTCVSFDSWVDGKFSYSMGTTSLQEVLQNVVRMSITWAESELLISLYLQKRLDIRFKSHLYIPLRRD